MKLISGKGVCLAFILSSLAAVGVNADVLLGWNVQGYAALPIPSNAPSVVNHSSLLPSVIDRGPGLTATGGTNGFVAGSWTLPVDSTPADAVASNDYFMFTVSPQPGASFTATNFTWRMTRSASAASNFFLRSSVDGYTADLATWSYTGTGNTNLTTALNLLSTNSVEFRLYGYGASAVAGTARFTDGGNIGQTGLDATLFGTATAPDDPPEVIVTTTNNTVPFGTSTYDVEGTANAFTVGQLSWTNALAGVGGTIPVSASWQIDDVPLAVGVNVIVVRGTNNIGVTSQDSVSITRQASPQPAVDVTTANQSVPNSTTEFDVEGTANTNTVGELRWTNNLTGASGTVPATANWLIDNVALAVGANVITVVGTNAFGVSAQDSVTITREVFLPPVGGDVLAFQGFEPGDSWTIISGGEFISDDPGATNTPANARIRTGDYSWQTTNSANTLELDAIDVTGKSNVAVRVRLASISGNAGNGADVGDLVRFFVALDEDEFNADAELAVRGNSNARWSYDATLTAHRIVDGSAATTNSAPQGGTSLNNYATVILYIPDGSTAVALKIVALNNDNNEIWAIDDIELLGDGEGGGGGDTTLDEYDIEGFALSAGVFSITIPVTSNNVPYSLLYTTDLLGNPLVVSTADIDTATGGPLTLQDNDPADALRIYWIRSND